MLELWNQSIAAVNLPYTILLGLVFLYWILYIVGAVGEDLLDFAGLDVDADLDAGGGVEADVDGDIDVGHGHSGGLLGSALHFFHVGEVPVILIFSVLVLAMWVVSVLTNYAIGNSSALVAAALFPPIVLAGLVITKTAIGPFAPLLKNLFDQSGDKVELIGRRCVVSSSEVTGEYGQCEIARTGAPLLLNVQARQGERLARGEEAVIFDYDKTNNVYLIAKLDIHATSKEG
ncbi:MAG: YqiJ family protein [Rhodopirellula sp.]|nr:YqiJ family protein [Rhodopirellula sp.]